MGDLQSDVTIDNQENAISGTLKYVTDYTGFSEVTEEQSGNYLATHWGSNKEATITAQLLPSEDVVTIGEDGILISRITDKDTQTLVITATTDDETATAEYDLSDLVLEAEEVTTPGGEG